MGQKLATFYKRIFWKIVRIEDDVISYSMYFVQPLTTGKCHSILSDVIL